MGIVLDTKPCPFCGTRLVHLGSWAKSFDPPRLYHEWHHSAVRCYLNQDGSRKILFSCTDDVNEMLDRIERWNYRYTDIGDEPDA